MYRYETHLHTSPVSACARATVRENLAFYAALGYEGVFITNHFLDGNVAVDPSLPYRERLDFYFSDYHEALRLSGEYGLKVFLGVEITYGGTDFLIYGLDEAWYYAHPQIMDMPKSQELPYLMAEGALVVHAHPYREAGYIDHIRLYPRCVQAVEVYNAWRKPLENHMAALYAEGYDLPPTAGTDNHSAERTPALGGMASDTPLIDERDYARRVPLREMTPFRGTPDGNGGFVFETLTGEKL